MLDLFDEFRALVDALELAGVEYAVCGSVPVVSRAGLVTMKRLRGSGQDLDDVRALEGESDES